MDNQSPHGDLCQKLSSFRANFSLPVFCKLQWQVQFWALIFEKFKITNQPNSVCFYGDGLARRQTFFAQFCADF
jgi:hypothetical protein